MKKNRLVLMALLLLASRLAQADSQWVLEQSTLTYHVSHPLHQSEGVSKAARGKGVCQAGQCDFLIAVPVKKSHRSEEHTSELQSPCNLVCRLLLEKKKKIY